MDAHDLLWGMTQDQLPLDAPEWARRVLLAARPVVVRRAVIGAGRVAVGVRGGQRSDRLAAEMPVASIQRRCRPEQLRGGGRAQVPALQALHAVTPLMDSLGLPWGPTGGVGYQLATGVAVLHQGSDLDLLLRTPAALSRVEAKALLQALGTAPCRIDLQLETPFGAVALAEWAGASKRVLLKSRHGACLVSNPWSALELSA
ncbi:malonate decarboxylase holo-ACP synthase [Pseudomonas sp. S75]|uniref:malonate decarboxylase holo-ACP synthase n=1 Tax=unclassified Pseudomonas TaxID=196821 RepID=UPI001908AB90|nr:MULTISPECIES: malonate decarboxylase holo-ACP synthase [unclassified Pseudomonas]MBJ9975181.1 malonate decarboxylase holo-ACP synthase [Pseudomonas sp. S30]MBK0153018.1 malonate decarboxylase holo-ACP synthase [Pseudomonas sp. S75]